MRGSSFFCSLLLFLPLVGQAQTYQSSVSKASGGAGRASIEPIDVIVLNPSTLVHLQGRHFTTSLQQKSFHVGLTDNTKQSQIPGGAGYFQTNTEYLGLPVDIKEFHLSLANFISRQWSLGLSVHYHEASLEDKRYRQFNGHLSTTWTPTPEMGFGLVVYDLAPISKEIPDPLQLTPSVGAGFNTIYNQFIRFRFDVKSAPNMIMNQLTYGLGFESYFAEWIITRGGFARDDYRNESWATAGLGFLGPRFYINYAYERTLARSETLEDRNTHSIDFGVPF